MDEMCGCWSRTQLTAIFGGWIDLAENFCSVPGCMGTYLYSIYSLTAQTIESNVYDSFRDLSHAFSGMGCLLNLILFLF